MACYIALYDFEDCDKETNRPLGLCLPIPFLTRLDAQVYLDAHSELWKGSPLFAYGDMGEITPEILKRWDKFCKKIKIINPLQGE
jgi:hypothetical protein